MAYDIAKCMGGDCPLKNDCYRFTSETLGRQDFFGSVPYNLKDKSCEHFWDNNSQIQALAYLIWLDEGKPNGKAREHWEKAKSKVLEINKY